MKMLLVQAQSYRAQYGFNAIFLLPVNLYGPRDNFDPESSHVIPALIRKYIEAKVKAKAEQQHPPLTSTLTCFSRKGEPEPSITAWGSGEPTR